jgi:hypothetical protein
VTRHQNYFAIVFAVSSSSVPVLAAFAKIGKLGIDFYRRGIGVQTGGDNDMPGEGRHLMR